MRGKDLIEFTGGTGLGINITLDTGFIRSSYFHFFSRQGFCQECDSKC